MGDVVKLREQPAKAAEVTYPASLLEVGQDGNTVTLLVEAKLPYGPAWLRFTLMPNGVLRKPNGQLMLMVKASCEFQAKEEAKKEVVNAEAQGK